MQSPTAAGGELGGEVKEEVPWYIKYGIRGLATFAGGLAIFFGTIQTVMSILSVSGILAGIWLMLVGCFVVTVESPCCCVFLENVQAIGQKIETKPLIIKAAVYFLAPIPTLIFDRSVSLFLGCGAVMAIGALFGVLAIGKKASKEEMAHSAQNTFSRPVIRTTTTSQYNTASNTTSIQPQPTNIKIDPLAAAAAAWGDSNNGNANNPNSETAKQPSVRTSWDQSFLESGYSSKPPGSNDPGNPFS